MTCAQGLLRLLWGGARSWSATGLAVTRMKLGNDKPSVLLWKMKSSFYGKPLDGVLIKLLRRLFLQALPSEIRLYLIGDDIPLYDIVQKADAIYAELKYNSQSSWAYDRNRLIYNFTKLYLIWN